MTALSPRPQSTYPKSANDVTLSEVVVGLDCPQPRPIALSVRGLCFDYDDGSGTHKASVLNHLDLTVYKGDRVGVIGCNGVGKTTLFHSICGVLTPTAGAIELFERPVQPGQFSHDVGLVFQNPNDQLFSARVWDDIAFGPQNMGLPNEDISRRVQHVMQVTGTQSLAERPPHQLSGGQKRMVAIASILAMQPKLTIFDEPSANLDCRSRRRLIHFLQEMSQTILLASHDLELVLEVCDRVVILDGGQVVADGPVRQMMANRDMMERYGLECPHSLTHTHNDPAQNASQNAVH
ncbi:MAG: ABC transporter ATP-binding protein [Cyanobacteria bacterium P01_G01_bin.4]